ncbi:hypothetical protein [Sphaerisporangium flaviroseum]|uniref:hypothetical protein n=1 Tax=Sphaerisporangium flaviroseum TaxID=509199 RepID=UPI0031E80D88
MAVATAITGGVVALSLPATAQAGTEVRTVQGHRVTHTTGHAPAALVTATTRKPPVGDDGDDGNSSRKKCCKKCPPGPPGPPGPRGRGDGIDTAFQGNNKFIGLAQGNGPTFIRDPRTTPKWNDISTLANYPGNVTDVSLAVMGNNLHVTVRSLTGLVAQTTCVVNPTPGTGGNPAWPGNCGAFVNLTPPL